MDKNQEKITKKLNKNVIAINGLLSNITSEKIDSLIGSSKIFKLNNLKITDEIYQYYYKILLKEFTKEDIEQSKLKSVVDKHMIIKLKSYEENMRILREEEEEKKKDQERQNKINKLANLI